MKSAIGVRRGQPPHRFILTPVSAASVVGSDGNHQSTATTPTIFSARMVSASTNSSNSSSPPSSSNSSITNTTTTTMTTTAIEAKNSECVAANLTMPNKTSVDDSNDSSVDETKPVLLPPPPPPPPPPAIVASSPPPARASSTTPPTTSSSYPTPPPSSGAMHLPGEDDDFGSFNFEDVHSPLRVSESSAMLTSSSCSSSNSAAFLLSSSPTQALLTSANASLTSSPLSSSPYLSTLLSDYNIPPPQQPFVRLLVRGDCMWSPIHSAATSPVHFDHDFGVKMEPLIQPVPMELTANRVYNHQQQNHNHHRHNSTASNNDDQLLLSQHVATNEATAQTPSRLPSAASATSFVNPSSVLPRMCTCSCQANSIDAGVPDFAINDNCHNCLSSDLFNQTSDGHGSALNFDHHHHHHHATANSGMHPCDGDFSMAKQPGELRACVTGRRALSSVLKRSSLDSFDDDTKMDHCTNSCCATNQSPGSMNLLTPALNEPTSPKRLKRPRSPSFIALSQSSAQCKSENSSTSPLISGFGDNYSNQTNASSSSSSSSSSFPVDITSYHSYTRNPCLRIVTSSASSGGSNFGQAESSSDTCSPAVLVQPLSSSSSSSCTCNNVDASSTPISTDSGVVICPSFFQPYPTPTDEIEPSSKTLHNSMLGDYQSCWSGSSSRPGTSTQSHAHAIFVQQQQQQQAPNALSASSSTSSVSSSTSFNNNNNNNNSNSNPNGNTKQAYHHSYNTHNHHHHNHHSHSTTGGGNTSTKRQNGSRHSTYNRPSTRRKNPNDHIKMERERRNDLKATFHHVREEVPELCHLPKPSKLAILDKAREYIETMHSKFREIEAEKDKLLKVNQQMIARLEALQRANGIIPPQQQQQQTPVQQLTATTTPTTGGNVLSTNSYVIVSAASLSH